MLAFVKATYDDEDDVFPVSPDAFRKRYGAKIVEVVSKMGPAARGQVVACGGRSVVYTSPIFCGWKEIDHPRPKDGDELLTLLASYVISDAIIDLLVAQARKIQLELIEESRLARGQPTGSSTPQRNSLSF